ncbi:MAG TPA: DUF3540 domain-containing protein [Sandaracinaceae bacterium LLY-WYZ-13_1]|nr:DUF3540 domain-containing protein [Sandaracinaceae bacterium LLY-WYZ-13_1]
MGQQVGSGARLVERQDEDERLVVELHAPDGELLVEYRPGDGTLRLRGSRVQVEARDELRLASGRTVRVDAPAGVTLSSGDSSVAVRPGTIGLLASRIEATAEQVTWSAKGWRLAADVVETEAERVVERVGELETRARRIVERVTESFREATGLAQTKAGRLRLVADQTLHAMGKRALFKAREDLKLRGERIYLD